MADIDLNGGHVAVAFGVVAAGLFVFHAAKTAGVPLPAAPVTEALVHVPDQLAIPYLIRPDLNRDTPRYTQHRYPDRVDPQLAKQFEDGLAFGSQAPFAVYQYRDGHSPVDTPVFNQL